MNTETVADLTESLDWNIPCERPRREREFAHHLNPCKGSGIAEWVLLLACGCGHVLYCTDCKNAVLAFQGRMQCKTCLTQFPSVREAYLALEPLDGRGAA